MQSASYVPSGLIVYLAITWLLRNAKESKAKSKDDTKIFEGTTAVRAILLMCILGFAVGSLYVSFTPPFSVAGATIFGLIAIAGTAAFPSPIFLGPAGIGQVYWWGGKVFLRWDDIVRVEFHRGPSTTVVVNRQGNRIVHSGFHRGRAEFIDICQRRAGIPVVTSEF